MISSLSLKKFANPLETRFMLCVVPEVKIISLELLASSSSEIIFTSGTTHSINLVSSGFANFLSDKDEIIVSQLEHHSNIVPWQMLCEKTGAKMKVIPMNDIGLYHSSESLSS